MTPFQTFDYDQMEREERPFAARLALWMSHKTPGRVVDLGAGSGVYVEELRRVGTRAQGYDIADPQPRPECVITRSLFDVEDAAPVVLCLEVAEHIPAEHERWVMDVVWRNCEPGGYVIWSAAQPGQGGVGHINCRPPDYWQAMALSRGFRTCRDLEADLDRWIRSGYHMGWFARNRQIWQRPTSQ